MVYYIGSGNFRRLTRTTRRRQSLEALAARWCGVVVQNGNTVMKMKQIERTLRRFVTICLAIFVALALGAVAESKSIPPESVDDQKIFWGSPSTFEKPGSVDYVAVVSATEDYKQARKVESGTARYWILVSKANEVAIRAISAVGSETDYDLIVIKGYLESLDPPIETDDITELALAKLSN